VASRIAINRAFMGRILRQSVVPGLLVGIDDVDELGGNDLVVGE